jgi:hypothetical protein
MARHHRVHYESDDATFNADAYTVRGWGQGIAFYVLGWEIEPDEDTEWSGMALKAEPITEVRSMRRSQQKCVYCPCASIPGLKKGQGLCAYHWCVGMYGIAYANQMHPTHKDTCKAKKGEV